VYFAIVIDLCILIRRSKRSRLVCLRPLVKNQREPGVLQLGALMLPGDFSAVPRMSVELCVVQYARRRAPYLAELPTPTYVKQRGL
jgi:hypothetical protein